jgi:hypothetical protein
MRIAKPMTKLCSEGDPRELGVMVLGSELSK